MLRIFDDTAIARRELLTRRPAAEAKRPADVRESNLRVYGRDLSPAESVDEILAAVRTDGDAGLRRFEREFGGNRRESLLVQPEEFEEADRLVPAEVRKALEVAVYRVWRFHERHRPTSWMDFDETGTLGQIVRPLERVALYAPGGRAAYPSTVIHLGVPARVAGVQEIVMASPADAEGRVAPGVLVASRLAGVDRVYAMGGAQAIAALAYGTESVPAVDKIVGPGNIFVALAKQKLFGVVGIDQIAGPTETLIIADESARPEIVAIDLLAQAEHDPMASAILITDSRELAETVAREVGPIVEHSPRRPILEDSVANNCGAVVAADIDEAIELANEYAPEHLCLSVADPWRWLPAVKNAGGIFLGESSAEAIGDYVSGPSHVMPTGGSARFSSPVSVAEFVKVSSLFAHNEQATAKLGTAGVSLAESEGLIGHAEAIRRRLPEPEDS